MAQGRGKTAAPKTKVFSCRLPGDHPIFDLTSKESKKIILDAFDKNETSETELSGIMSILTNIVKDIQDIKAQLKEKPQAKVVKNEPVVPAYEDERLESAAKNFLNF